MTKNDGCGALDYVTRVVRDPATLDANAWNRLLELHPQGGGCGPFMRHAYLNALHASGSAVEDTGWAAQWITLWETSPAGERLQAAAPLYVKNHSYGEYVFDWAWANAYAQHGLAYYPKAVVAVPFTPVPGPRLLAADRHWRGALLRELLAHCEAEGLSSMHLLFGAEADLQACEAAGLMTRQTVQFHWKNAQPIADPNARADVGQPWASFDDFMHSLSQDKRKKIRQERRKVSDAGIRFEVLRGRDIAPGDWDFFYRCYAQTYWEHNNAPYLSRDFFQRLAQTEPEQWLLFKALRPDGQAVACSLVALSDASAQPQVAYGRYWGALERVDCLHFEACYYQPLAWCMANGVQRFEGGAQGEHKMARALLPVSTHSAHWLAHPAFADAVERFLARESQGVAQYMAHLESRNPFRQAQNSDDRKGFEPNATGPQPD